MALPQDFNPAGVLLPDDVEQLVAAAQAKHPSLTQWRHGGDNCSGVNPADGRRTSIPYRNLRDQIQRAKEGKAY